MSKGGRVYLPWWALILLVLFVAFIAYEAGEKRVRKAWRQEERERRERRRRRKRERRQAATWQRIRAEYGEDLDDEAVSMIYDVQYDELLSLDSKNLAITFELLENHRRAKEREQQDTKGGQNKSD
jgi:hypothetical protein